MALSIDLTLERNFSNENSVVLLWIAFVAVNLLDFISTVSNVATYGAAVEMNPFIRPVIEYGGTVGLATYKLTAFAILSVILFRWITYQMLIVLNVVFLAIVYGNVYLH